ncbi:dna-binding sap [Nannochloropsis oceanica]
MENSYATLSYRDLRKLCKTHGLMCKGKTAELQARLVAHAAAEQGGKGDLSAAAPQAGTDSDEGEAAQQKKREDNLRGKVEQLGMVMDGGIEKAGHADKETVAAPTAFPPRAPREDMFSDMPDLVAQPTAAAAAAAAATTTTTTALEAVSEIQEAKEMKGFRRTAINVIKRKAESGGDAPAASTTKNGSNTTAAESHLPKKVPKVVSMLRKPSPASASATQGIAAMAGGASAGAGRATTTAATPVSSTKKATTMKTISSSRTSNKIIPLPSGPRSFGPGTFSLKNNSCNSSGHHKAAASSSSSSSSSKTTIIKASAASADPAPCDPSKPRPKPTYKPHTGKLPPYKDTRNVSLFSPCPVMPARKASVPKQQRGPSTTTITSNKYICNSGITEKCTNIHGKNKENNKAGSTTSY